MKYILLCVLLCTTLFTKAAEPIKIGVITDTHYLSEKLMDGGYAVENYVYMTGRNVDDAPAVLDQVLTNYLQSDIQVLLICGDITKDGEKQSHLDFAKKLKPLQDKGIQVYVVPGNHDINMSNAVEFKGDKVFSVPGITPDEFAGIYSAYGYKDAVSRDNASLSYVAGLSESVWLLSIDAARYSEYRTGSITSGRILPETEEWIVDVLDEAESRNIQVIGMMHWGLTEHILYQSSFFKEYLVADWQRLATLFADKGMKAVFTGHFHSNDISLFTSATGNKIYDIETGSLTSYPFSYRFVDLYSNRMAIRTKNVASVPGNPNLAGESKAQMQGVAKKLAIQKLKKQDYELSSEVLPLFADVLSKVFVLHLFGDEQLDDDLRSAITNLSDVMGDPVDLNDIELDFYPADNNIEIVF